MEASVTTQSTVEPLFPGFPRAQGQLVDPIAAFKAGDLDDRACASRLLELATGVPAHEAFLAEHHSSNLTRNMKPAGAYAFLFDWLLKRGVRLESARQYTLRLETLAEQGYLERGAEALLEQVDNDTCWPNRWQVLAALRILVEFQREEGLRNE